MKNIAMITAAAIVAATVGSAAIAQDTTPFKSADANNDGWISWEEAMGAIPTLTEDQYKTADANGDGNLDEGEFNGLLTLFGTSSAQ